MVLVIPILLTEKHSVESAIAYPTSHYQPTPVYTEQLVTLASKSSFETPR